MSTEGNDSIKEDNYRKIKEFVDSISYGTVTIVIQDGKIIQLEKNEKIRLR